MLTENSSDSNDQSTTMDPKEELAAKPEAVPENTTSPVSSTTKASTVVTPPMDDSSCWDGPIKRLWLPRKIVPLPVMTKPFFPNATRKFIQATYRYIPGSSPFVEPIPAEPAHGKEKGDDEESALGGDHATKEKSSSGPDKIGSDEKPKHYGKGRLLRKFVIPPFFIRYKLETMQMFMIICFSIALLVALAYDGYKAQTAHGLPQKLNLQSRFWPEYLLDMQSSMACGPGGVNCLPFSTNNSWFGYQCLGANFLLMGSAQPVVRGGQDGFYTTDSAICPAALHAGVIDLINGGCFELRFTGPKDFFHASYANGINTTEFGSFVASMEFRTVSSVNCGNVRAVSIVVATLGLIAMSVIWRVDPMWLNFTAAQWNFYYNGLFRNRQSGGFWIAINTLSAKQFTLIPMCIFLFYWFGRPGFCPDPRRFPLEALVFFCLFFWTAAQIDNIGDRLGPGFNFSSSSISSVNAGTLAILIIAGVFLFFFGIFQIRDIYRAGLMPYYYTAIGLMAIYFIIVAYASEHNLLSFHFHHYFLGLCLCILGRGQNFYSIILQAIGLGLFVEGLVVWGTAPLFDQNGGPFVGYQTSKTYPDYTATPIVTRIDFNLSEPTAPQVNLEWTMPTNLALIYNCSANVTRLLPSVFRGLLKSPNPLLAVDTMPFVVAQNGILLPGVFPNFAMNETFSVDTTSSTTFTPYNPAVFTIGSSAPGTSPSIPIPFPFSSDYSYYDANATLCDRLYGIYSKLNFQTFSSLLRHNNQTVPAPPWWLTPPTAP